MRRARQRQPKPPREEAVQYDLLGPMPAWKWPLVWLGGVVPMVAMGYVFGGLGMWEYQAGGMLMFACLLGGIWTAVVAFGIRDQYRANAKAMPKRDRKQ